MTKPATLRETLTEPNELLHRVVHPSFVHDGRISSQVFRPTPKDTHQLSVDRSSLSTAPESFARYCARGLRAYGVVAVSVGECGTEKLPVLSDPIPVSDTEAPNHAHALIDFRPLASDRARDRSGKVLSRIARERGWLHREAGDAT